MQASEPGICTKPAPYVAHAVARSGAGAGAVAPRPDDFVVGVGSASVCAATLDATTAAGMTTAVTIAAVRRILPADESAIQRSMRRILPRLQQTLAAARRVA